MSKLEIYNTKGSSVTSNDQEDYIGSIFLDGVLFYTTLQEGRVKYHCFFRGMENSGRRSEQYYAAYVGDANFSELKNEVKKEMNNQYPSFSYDERKDNFLYVLAECDQEISNINKSIKRALENDKNISFKVSKPKKSAQLVKYIISIELRSKDNKVTIGVTKDSFPKGNKPEVSIYVDDSVDGISSSLDSNSTSNNTNGNAHSDAERIRQKENESSSFLDRIFGLLNPT